MINSILDYFLSCLLIELSRMSDMYTPDRRFKMESTDSTFNIRIEGVEKWDAGKYKCGVRAKRSGTEIERIVELEVPSKSRIKRFFSC